MSSYTVVKGDSMSSIAAKFNITIMQLEAANPQVTDPNLIQIGQVLNIPGAGSGLTPNQLSALQLHNSARQAISAQTGHARPDLVWDTDLESSAQQWANHLIATGTFEHSGTPNVGENLSEFFPASGATVMAATQGWLDEAKFYHGQPIDGNFAQYGHYTQVRISFLNDKV